jgi:RNA methyltransferase, TrmH family
MITQNQVKHIRSLKFKKFRDEHKQFIAEGPKLVKEMIDSKYIFDCIFAKKEWLADNSDILLNKGIRFEEITGSELERISGFTAPNMVLAVINVPSDPIPEKILGNETLLVLDDIKDPGNLGAIIRTADWFGISSIICSENTVELYNPKVIQATMGSIARVNIYYTDLIALLKENNQKASVYGTFMDGKSIREVKPDKNSVILIGNESRGISTDLQPFINCRVSIPLYRKPDGKSPESLNASIAAAIMCYEFRKKE